ncbi:MAG TPA: IS256 family transposase [Microthrixaceae bacterium]|nr:IS256 family transposase [Microthrixaceae bacterium]
MARVQEEGLELLGPDGVLTGLTSRIMNRALEAEMTDHLGYEHGDPAGHGSGNNRNGTSAKTVLTDAGGVPVRVPRDRNGEFEPKLVPKHARRLKGFNDIVLSLLSRGMTTRDIESHLADTYQVDVSPELISKITDSVLPIMREWQARALDPLYPVLYLDAIVVKVRTDGRVTNRPVYIAMAIDLEGRKDVLGLWLGTGDEGSKYWLSVLTELKNRGVEDVLIACCDGLTGFGDAINAVWPQTVVQTCVVHLIRNSVRFVSYKDRRAVVRALKPIYTAPTVDAAELALEEFERTWGATYGAIGDLWRRNWERFIPFLDFDPAIRKIIYTTNAIESLNYQLRKVTKTRGSFPTDDAVLKIFYLAIDNIGHNRGGHLGTNTQGWKQALNAFTIAYPGRIPDFLN